jgi:hypothetical protein
VSRLITVRQAKKILGKNSEGAVYDLVARGIIPPGPLVRLGRSIRFNEDLLREFLEKGGTATDKNNEAREQTVCLPATA